MSTISAKPGEVVREWYVVDAEGQVLGRLAARIANVLRGKHKSVYTPHVDTGDFVIVVNADKVRLTGNKLDHKKYHRYTGYPSGIRTSTAREMIEAKPDEVIRHAVRGMLPKNRLNRRILTKLKVYRGPDHPHAAQQPKPLELKTR